jgi:hypothetical protein
MKGGFLVEVGATCPPPDQQDDGHEMSRSPESLHGPPPWNNFALVELYSEIVCENKLRDGVVSTNHRDYV